MGVLVVVGCFLAGCSGGGGASGSLPALSIAAAATGAPTHVPTTTPSPSASASPSPSPSKATIAATPLPSATVTTAPPAPQTPTTSPTDTPTTSPTDAPTSMPTQAPTPVPTQVPTPMPTRVATPIPTPTATPTPKATATPTIVAVAPQPTATAAAIKAVVYPVYSSYFTAKTPFHDTVAQLVAAGARVLSPTIAKNYWAQGVSQNVNPANPDAGISPTYVVKSGDPAYTFACAEYGKCNASGMTVHYPVGAAPSKGSDHHLVTFDTVYAHAEIDGWGGDTAHACTLTPPSGGGNGYADCSWGGVFPFGGNGLATDYSASNAGGYAYGLMDVSAQEVLNGHIDHALGIGQSCLDSGGVYPAGIGRTTDSPCPKNLEPNAVYGDLIHLKSSVDVASLGYSPYCRLIVQALQTYGAYTADNNGGFGISLEVEFPNNPAYTTDPWYTKIFPSMVAGGDGTGSGTNFRYSACLQRIPADDIEVLQISQSLP